MFFHNLKYDLKTTFRNKSFFFWVLVFPIILGTFFRMAFGDIYENDVLFNSIPTAIVETKTDENFRSVIDEISKAETPLLNAEYMDEKTALEKLEKDEIQGIIYVDEDITLKVYSGGTSIAQTILREFLDSYRMNKSIITDTAMNNPQNLEAVVNEILKEVNSIENVPLTEGNMDTYVQYFYNLIAMAAFFGSITGLHVAIQNQGNLSEIAARKCISPTNKIASITADLLASFIAQTICVAVATTYVMVVLGIDLGDNIPLIYLSGAIGSLTGVTMGFFIGSFGRMGTGVKAGIATCVTMFLCFLSGLMVGDMKYAIEENIPVINRISPPALISDLFYCLNVDINYGKYTEKAVVLLILSVAFTTGGFLLTRRKKYASL